MEAWLDDKNFVRLRQHMWLPGSLSNEHAILRSRRLEAHGSACALHYGSEELRAKMRWPRNPRRRLREDTEGVGLMLAITHEQ